MHSFWLRHRVLTLLFCFAILLTASAPAHAAAPAPGARYVKGTHALPLQQDYTVLNRMTSSTGASMIAFGECGSARSAIHLGNGGYEYYQVVEIPMATAGQQATWIWGGWKPIRPTEQVTLDLPDAYVYRYFLIQGADSTTQGWEYQSASTAFTHLPKMNILYWC